ncbi:hypothetical protein MRX96_031771 [Rhipicephalus microplus]
MLHDNADEVSTAAPLPVGKVTVILQVRATAASGGHPTELGPPPRWLNCPRKGALIAEKFLPFKTPLSEVYDAQVPEENRFPPSMLLDSLSSYKLKMGLWIDLTNTDRFYNPKVVEEREVRYLKLQCRGHGECPSEEQTDLFIELCQRFISKNPLHIIGGIRD